MSEIRTANILWKWRIASDKGKKTLKIELFLAEQWRRNWSPYRQTMWPKPPLRDRQYWQQYYRVRVGGKWITRPGFKYVFFTLPDVLLLVEEQLLRKGVAA